MQRHIILLVICAGAVACSATAPPSTSPDKQQVSGTTPASQAASEAPSMDGRESVPAGSEDVIPVSEVPAVPEVDHARAQAEIICQRVKPTGSHRARRVCRTRAEIERESLAGKEAFDEMHRAQRNNAGN